MHKASPGRPARINSDMIEKAVIEVGFDKVSTTVVARHLGVEQSSLYRHITSRRELLLSAVRRVVADTDFTVEAETWREYLLAIIDRVWTMLIDHPGMAGVIFELDAPPPEQSSALTVAAVQELSEYGFSERTSLLVLETLLNITCTAVHRTEHNSDEDEEQGTSEASVSEVAQLRPDDRTWWLESVNLVLDGAEKALNK